MDDLREKVDQLKNRVFWPTLQHAIQALWYLRESGVCTGFRHKEPRDALERVRGLKTEEGLRLIVQNGDVDLAITIWWSFGNVDSGLRGSEVERAAIRKRLGDDPDALAVCLLGLERMHKNGWRFLTRCRIDPKKIDLQAGGPLGPPDTWD